MKSNFQKISYDVISVPSSLIMAYTKKTSPNTKNVTKLTSQDVSILEPIQSKFLATPLPVGISVSIVVLYIDLP